MIPVICPGCWKEASYVARTCPHCGRSVAGIADVIQREEDLRWAWSRARRPLLLCVVCIVAGALLIAYGLAITPAPTDALWIGWGVVIAVVALSGAIGVIPWRLLLWPR
jgi:hypothetical protein